MRLLTFCGVESTPIYNPPFGEKNFYHSDAEDYLLFPSRINVTKRQELAIEALAKTKNAVRLYIAGAADHPTYQKKLIDKAKELGLTARIKWLGAMPDLYDAYARCLGVVFVPIDEDYGYVTLEAMLSSKPVITCTDSGGTLEFVNDGATGMTVEPTPEALAEGMDILWENRETAERYGREGRDQYRAMNITWSNVTKRLLQ
jgi:glycosyltransferase involved in cell wall biosynthesis